MSVKNNNYTDVIFSEIFESSLDAIIVIDQIGLITMFNPTAEILFDYRSDDVIGKNIKILMPEPYCQKHDGYIQHYLETGQSNIINVGRELIARKRNGTTFPMYLRINEVKIATDSFFVGFIQDISVIKAINEELALKTKIYDSQIWLRDMQINLNKAFVGEKKRDILCEAILANIVTMTKSDVGVFYFMENDELNFISGYAYPAIRGINKTLAIGEGLSGLAAATNKIQLMNDFSESNLVLESSIETLRLKAIMAVPLAYEDKVLGVIEIGAKNNFFVDTQDFMEQVRGAIATNLNSVLSREQIKLLLEKTQDQAQELNVQASELIEKNFTLSKQAEELQLRQQEIEQNNQELEEQTNQLEETNADLEMTQESLQKRTKDLEDASRYKSEFLANVSHELRTPLNSILVLSQLFMENKKSNLDNNQLESAETIYNCGNNLLLLINDILDLSKVEANQMNVISEEVTTEKLLGNLRYIFTPLVSQKNLHIKLYADKDFPKSFISDSLRLEQILRNFISNAVKFTKSGEIKVKCSIKDYGKCLVFAVIDTGIGIAKEHLEDIFLAFQQVDGTVSRKYGGTGLGLTIALKLSQLLGGSIKVRSELGHGSIFSLHIPYVNVEEKINKTKDDVNLPTNSYLDDDRDNLDPMHKTLLIVENDRDFLSILVSLAKQQNFQVLLATNGIDALQIANDYLPDGIILDIRLPEMDGISVLKALKDTDKTRYIPVHVITATDFKEKVLSLGALSFLLKPVDKKQLLAVYHDLIKETSVLQKQLVLLVDDNREKQHIKSIFKGYAIKFKCFKTVKRAFTYLKNNMVDGIILDADLQSANGFELLDLIQNDSQIKKPPVIIYTSKELAKKAEKNYSELYSTVVRKTPGSDQKLLQEAHNFFQQVGVSHSQKYVYREDKKSFSIPIVMIVDDDERSIFTLRKILEPLDILIITASNGKEAIDLYDEYPNTALILMDMMLPLISGYDATRTIRHKNATLPIIAITAKSMPEDRQECLDAGCSDYLSKPVNPNQLLSLLKIRLE